MDSYAKVNLIQSSARLLPLDGAGAAGAEGAEGVESGERRVDHLTNPCCEFLK